MRKTSFFRIPEEERVMLASALRPRDSSSVDSKSQSESSKIIAICYKNCFALYGEAEGRERSGARIFRKKNPRVLVFSGVDRGQVRSTCHVVRGGRAASWGKPPAGWRAGHAPQGVAVAPPTPLTSVRSLPEKIKISYNARVSRSSERS